MSTARDDPREVGPPIERSAELRRIAAAVDRTRRGDGVALLISGEPGIGKSTLLGHVASSDGFTVLHARCSDLESGFGLGVVLQLLGPTLRTADGTTLDRWFRGPAAVVRPILLGDDPIDTTASSPTRFAMFHSLYWLVANMAEDGPVAIVVDDLQWSDDESAAFLDLLAGRLDGLRVLVAGATRTGHAASHHRWSRATDHLELILSPLSQSGVRALLHDRWGAEPSDSFVHACLHATNGVPFHLHALATALIHGGASPDDEAAERVAAVAPSSVLVRVLAHHDDIHRVQACRALAILDDDPTLAEAAAVAELEPVAFESARSRLQREGLLAPDRLALVHPIVMTAVLSELTAAEREHLHRLAAETLALTTERQPDSPPTGRATRVERIAAHLLAAPPIPQEWARQVLLHAAARATSRQAHTEAATYLRRARELTPPDPVELEFQLGMALLRAGSPAAVTSLRDAVDRGVERTWWPQAVGALAQVLAYTGRPDAAAATLHDALPHVEDPAVRLELEVDEYFYLIITDQTASATGLGHRILADLDAANSPTRGVMRGAIALHAVHRNEPATHTAALAKLGWVQSAGSCAPTHRRTDTVMALALSGDLVAAGAAADELLHDAERRGDQAGIAISMHLRGRVLISRGLMTEAEAEIRDCLHHASESVALGVPIVWDQLTEVLLARHGAPAASEITSLRPDWTDQVAAGPADHLRLGSGRLSLALGDPGSALHWFRACGQHLAQREGAGIAQFPWRVLAVDAAVALAELDEARLLAEESLTLADDFGAPQPLTDALLAVAAVARAEQRDDLPVLERAWSVVEPTDHLLTRARAALALGRRLVADDSTRARDLFEVALDAADRCGAGPLRGDVVTALHTVGARPRRARRDGPAALTASELRVARLAAAGLMNRQIAEELFVTVKTVEVHLTKAYRKLGVSSRDRLAAALEP